MTSTPQPTPFQDEILALRLRIIGLTSNISSQIAWSGGGWHRASGLELAAMRQELSAVRARVRTLLTGIRAEELAVLAALLKQDKGAGTLAWLQREARKR